MIYLGKGEFKADDAKDYFKKEAINPYTLKYFFFLDDKFKNSRNTEELLQSCGSILTRSCPQTKPTSFSRYTRPMYITSVMSMTRRRRGVGLPHRKRRSTISTSCRTIGGRCSVARTPTLFSAQRDVEGISNQARDDYRGSGLIRRRKGKKAQRSEKGHVGRSRYHRQLHRTAGPLPREVKDIPEGHGRDDVG